MRVLDEMRGGAIARAGIVMGEGGSDLGDENFESSKNQGYSPLRSELLD